MRKAEELVESLYSATSWVVDAVSGHISVEEFVTRYANFYYYEALDGHEADDQTTNLLNKYKELIDLHEEIQTNVVDLVYLGPPEKAPEFIAAGRLSPELAAERLAELARRYEIQRWLERLRAT